MASQTTLNAKSVNTNSLNVASSLVANSGQSVLSKAHDILTPASSVTINNSEHSGKTLLIPSTATTNDTYVLPVASFIGETYHFVYSASAADTDNIIFSASAASALTFTGGILDVKTNEAGADLVVMKYPGAAHEKYTITNVEFINVTFVATTLTNYCVSGITSSTDTASVWADF